MAKPPPTLKKRRDFLACAKARRWVAPGFVLQARRRPGDDPGAARVGYTCSKKVGGAVVRNRAKRRLRALAAEALPERVRTGWDYVLIGRAGVTITNPFDELKADLETALDKVHAPRRPAR